MGKLVVQFCTHMVELSRVTAVENDVEVLFCELVGVVLADAVAGAGDYCPRGRTAIVMVVVVARYGGAADEVDPDEPEDFPGEEGCPDCTDQGEKGEIDLHFECRVCDE